MRVHSGKEWGRKWFKIDEEIETMNNDEINRSFLILLFADQGLFFLFFFGSIGVWTQGLVLEFELRTLDLWGKCSIA
jgi:hypothetical protein